jgi:hypothetical protein
MEMLEHFRELTQRHGHFFGFEVLLHKLEVLVQIPS